MGFKYPVEKYVSKGMWCKHFKIKFWSRTIYCSTNYLNEWIYARVGGHMKSHDALNCCWKRKMLLLIHAKVSKRKGCWSTINLVAMIEVTKAHFVNKLLGRWWLSIWTQCHQNLLGKKLVYVLEVLLGCRRILNSRGTQTLKKKKVKKVKNFM